MVKLTKKKWFVYIVECADIKKTLYTGISTDVTNRIKKHNLGKGSKNLRGGKLPVVCRYTCQYENKSLAAKEEWRIKQLTKEEKLDIINEKEL